MLRLVFTGRTLCLALAIAAAPARGLAWEDTTNATFADSSIVELGCCREGSWYGSVGTMCPVEWSRSAGPLDGIAGRSYGFSAGCGWLARQESESMSMTAPISMVEARSALDKAESLTAAQNWSDALLWLRVAEHAAPRLADRLAFKRAEILMRMGQPSEACLAFRTAQGGLNRDLAILAEVGSVRCALAAGDRKGERLLTELLAKYPGLTQAADLYFDLAKAYAGWGDRQSAIALFRYVDITYPTGPAAERARAELERARQEGVALRDYTFQERFGRAERLVDSAPVEPARQAVDELLSLPNLNPRQRARAHVLAARIARWEGRWDQVRKETAEARKLDPQVPGAGNLEVQAAASAEVQSAEERAARRALGRVRQIQGGRPIRKLDQKQLSEVLQIAVLNGLTDVADEVVSAMQLRRGSLKDRFNAAMLAVGVASEDKIAALLTTLFEGPQYRSAAHYHHARCLERLGRLSEAEAEYRAVIAGESSLSNYYAMWAEQRLADIASQRQLSCVSARISAAADPASAGSAVRSGVSNAGAGLLLAAVSDSIGISARLGDLADRLVRTFDTGSAPPTAEGQSETPVQKLAPLVEAHGNAYPWLGRALDLMELGKFSEAADELYEAYLAWRDARGSLRIRSGLETLFTGSPPARRPADNALRSARLALGRDEFATLAEVAKSLGDMGLTFRFGGWAKTGWPRAYSEQVEKAAGKYGIDPNLLFAIMRSESIYDRRIISHAGAVGLMQIMPRTGRLIARSMDRADFEVTDLLDPQISVELSARHLVSLLNTFQGCTALAVAAYNAGSHNVKRWMRQSRSDVPLDVFLERIPFRETYLYVRHVLSQYATYRAQQGLPMERMSISLPEPRPDL